MRIAHLSDLHILGERAIPLGRLFNKRLTGYANLRLRRRSIHKREVAAALARELGRRAVDHVVITGDLTNLALEGEFESAVELIESELGLRPDQVSVVPGNHDVYTQGSAREKRFCRYLERYLTTDLPGFDTDHPAGPFPYVQLRGPVAFLGLSTALPRLPFLAAGEVGHAQLSSLGHLLQHPEVRSRLPVVLLHHPPHNPRRPLRAFTSGLWDAPSLLARLGHTERVVALHGHLHERVHWRVPTAAGQLDSIGATSASLLHEHPDRMAGFNLYETDGAARFEARALVYDAGRGAFDERAIPMLADGEGPGGRVLLALRSA